MVKIARKAYVYDGSAWVDLASSTTDLSAYAPIANPTFTGTVTVNGRVDATHLPYAVSANTVTMSISAASNTNASVTFPSGRFTQTPIVTASLSNAPGGSAKLVARAISSSTTGTSIYVYTGDSTTTTATNFTVSWQAIQMTSSAGGG